MSFEDSLVSYLQRLFPDRDPELVIPWCAVGFDCNHHVAVVVHCGDGVNVLSKLITASETEGDPISEAINDIRQFREHHGLDYGYVSDIANTNLEMLVGATMVLWVEVFHEDINLRAWKGATGSHWEISSKDIRLIGGSHQAHLLSLALTGDYSCLDRRRRSP